MFASLAALTVVPPFPTGPLPQLEGYTMVVPQSMSLLRQSGNSTLHELVLPTPSYAQGRVLVATLRGGRAEIGRAYGALLHNETIDTLQKFLGKLIPDASVRDVFLKFADFLWDRYESAHVPQPFLDELAAMPADVAAVTRRFNTLGNLPADPQNLITALEFELEKGLPPALAAIINAVINELTKCTWCAKRSDGRARLPFAPGCDAFAAWGSRTAGGRLFSSRNLDWNKDTGIAAHKLVTVFHPDDGTPPYATFGFASGLGAIAGMSKAGLTVSEMNLDNSRTAFEGPPFPTRLRLVLEGATTLAEARSLWEATNNTDSMNYMVASGTERNAMAIEAMRSYSAFFGAADPVEANATCAVGMAAGGTCGNGFPEVNATAGGRKPIGAPLADAVFRTNHAVHPTLMATQEPLFNDTTFRYQLLRKKIEDASAGGAMDDAAAVQVAASLGIKGADFLSCDPAQFGGGDNIMSIVYAPADAAPDDTARAWVAWEDKDAAGAWRPAACNAYVRVDLAGMW